MEILSLSSIEMSEVEYDENKLPKSWPLLRAGDNIITRSRGMPVNLKLDAEDLANIASYHSNKGAKIPLDCNHVVSNLAGKLGIDEDELLRRLPRYSGVAGFANLELRGNALYVVDAEFLPIGKEVMAAGQLRYFSPSIRGLDNQSPLRITSVALTNNPHLQNVADLAAGEVDDDDDEKIQLSPEVVQNAQTNIVNQPKKAKIMEEETKKTAEELSAEEKAQAANKSAEELMALLKEVLGEEITADNLRVTLAALKTKAEGTAELSDKVKKLECAEEARNRAAIVAKGLANGRFNPDKLKLPYVAKMSAAELSDYHDSLSDDSAAPMGTLELGEYRRSTPRDTSKMTAAQKAIAEAPVR